MSKVYDFIKECNPFFVLTINEDFPAGRPFGAIMELGEDLYISTADTKAVYAQLKRNGNIQLIAVKPGTRDWIRVSGIASECNSIEVKAQMLEACPVLKTHYTTAEDAHFNVFQIRVVHVDYCF